MLKRLNASRPLLNATLLPLVLAAVLALPGTGRCVTQTAPSPRQSKEERSNSRNPNQIMAAAQAAVKRQDYAAAINDLEPLAKDYPDAAPVWFELAYAHTGLHQNEAAVNAYQKAIKLDPKLFQARLNLGILLIMMNRPADALPQLREAVALKPGDTRAHLFLGRAEALTDGAGAAKEFRAASGLDPHSSEAWLDLGQLRFKRKDYAGARDAFEKASTLDPKLEEAKLGAGLSLQNLKQDALAVPYLEQYLAAKPDDTKVRFDLARIELYLGHYPEALAELKTVEKQNASLPGLDGAFGDVYAELKQFADAEKYYRLALAAGPAQPTLHQALGETLMQEKNYTGAEAEFRAALKLDPTNRDAASGIAASLYFQKRYTDAIPVLLSLVQTPPAALDNYFLLAGSYDHLHDQRPAIAAYHQFLSLSHGKDPDQEWQAQQRIKLLEHELER